MSPHALLEVPIFGPSDAAVAADAGAARLELNATGSYPFGGTTPAAQELVAVNIALTSRSSKTSPLGDRLQKDNDGAIHSKHDVPIRVMIRPRGPPPPYDPLSPESPRLLVESVDFQYTPAEVEIMESSIRDLKEHLDPARGDGFVFGALTLAPKSQNISNHDAPSVSLDSETCCRLIAAAQPFTCVFHRAFDLLATRHKDELQIPLRQIKEHGFHGILTSGGVGNAADYASSSLPAISGIGSRHGLEIIIGGGVRSANVADLMAKVAQNGPTIFGARSQASVDLEDPSPGQRQRKTQWVHSSCLTSETMKSVDTEEVAAIIKQITDFGLSRG